MLRQLFTYDGKLLATNFVERMLKESCSTIGKEVNTERVIVNNL